MADFSTIPVVDVQNNNFKEVWPTLMLGLKTATFVSLDLELSGLGDRGKLFAKVIEDRYKIMRDVAKTRSVVSLGLSCFRLTDHQAQNPSQTGDEAGAVKGRGLKFVVQTYNIMLLCSESYMVEPASMRFLVEHGFDFNKQYATGISYYRGNDREQKEAVSVRQLFSELVRQEIPIVVHNGLVDLVFLYQNFYADLPPVLTSFVADMSEMFAGGIYDTKYITEFQARYPASFLQYTFRKSQRDNYRSSQNGERHSQVSTLKYPASYRNVTYLECAIKDMSAEKHINVCEHFASHGWCQYGSSCPLSHDVDLALDNEHIHTEKKRKKKNRRKKKKLEAEQLDDSMESGISATTENDGNSIDKTETDGISEKDDNQEMELDLTDQSEKQEADIDKLSLDSSTDGKTHKKGGGHRAGFDAFMTGFIFAHFLAKYGKKGVDLPENPKLKDMGFEEYANKLCLSGKDIPLQVMKSGFAKSSKDHRQKLEKIKTQW